MINRFDAANICTTATHLAQAFNLHILTFPQSGKLKGASPGLVGGIVQALVGDFQVKRQVFFLSVGLSPSLGLVLEMDLALGRLLAAVKWIGRLVTGEMDSCGLLL